MLELLTDLSRHFFLVVIQIDWVPELFARVWVSLDLAINGWTATRFSMSVVSSHCVNFYVKAIGGQELLIQVAALCPNSGLVLGRDELRAVGLCLAEEDGVAGATRTVVAVVDHDLVVLCIHGLLDERLFQDLAFDDDTVVVLLHIVYDVLIKYI